MLSHRRSILARLSAFSLLGGLLGLSVGCGRDSTYPTPPAPIQVTVTVASVAPARVNTSVPFVATVTGTSNTAVTWQVNGITGGNATVGTISAAGLYTAPAVVPAPDPVTVKAVSVAVPSASGTADETIWNPVPVITSAAASYTGANGAVLLDILGTGFVAGAQVSFGGPAQAATVLSATEIQTTFTPATGVTAVSVAVLNPNPGSATSNTVTVALPQVTVTVSGPLQARIGAAPSQYTAAVTGAGSNTAVTWAVQGSPATGTISASGIYTPPTALPATNPVTITATSVAVPTASGSLQVSLLNCVPTLTSGTATHTGANGTVLLDVLGTCFVAGTQLSLAGTTQAATVLFATELQATFTPAAGVTSVAVAAITPNPGSATSNTITLQIPQVTVTITGPSPTRLGQSVQLSATVTNTPNTAVTWAVQGAPAAGSITPSGVYTAPATLPTTNPVTITATSQDVASAVGQFSEGLTNPVPVIASATATQTCANAAVLLDILGSNFVSGAQVTVNGTPQSATFVSSTELQTTYTPAPGATSVTVTVVNPNPGSAASNSVTVQVPQIAVTVSGPAQTRIGLTNQFTAATTTCTASGVTWQVNGVTGGNAASGTISTTGLFTAPAAVPASNPVTITAVSQANTTVSGSLSETIWNAVPAITTATATQTCTTGGSVLVDVHGTGFVSGSTLQFTGVGATVFVSSTELQATFTPANGVTSISVTVLNPNPGSATSTAVNVTVPQIGITVSGPASTRLGLTSQFTTAIASCPGSAVTWQVNGVTGGSATTGTISSTGLFTAPIGLPSPNPVSLTATSQVNTAVVSNALQETIGNPVPVINSGTAVETNGSVLLDLLGTGFVNGAQINIAGTLYTATYISATELQATFTPPSTVTSVAVFVINPNPVSATSNSITVPIVQILVTVTGPAQTRLGLTNQFTATVSGTGNQAVTWQVNGVTGGSAATGTISTSGLFTAPTSLPSPNPVTLTAISAAYPTVSGSLSETIWNSTPAITSATATLTNTPDAVLLDVLGTGFDGGAQIVVAGSSLITTLVSSTEVQATYNPTSSQEHNTYQNTVPVATSISVTVVNPNPGSATSNAVSVALPELYAYTGAQPADETASPYFTLSVGGVPVFLHQAEVNILNFASFTSALNGVSYNPNPPYLSEQGYTSFGTIQLVGSSMITIGFNSGYPVSGPITSASQIKILPTGAIDPTTIKIVNGTIQFPVTQSGTAQQLTIDVDGDYLNSFNLWINPFDTIPAYTAANVVPPGYITTGLINALPSPYIFGPGEYIVSGSGYNMTFRNSSEVYLADGAIIHRYSAASADGASGPMITLGGNPYVTGINMYMHGSGIIDGNGSQGDAAPYPGCGYGTSILTMIDLTLSNTSKVGIDGVTFRNSCAFSVPISNVIGTPTNHAFINNVKVLGWRHNSDAMDVFSDQYLDITHSYFRTDDDLVVIDQLGTPPGSHASSFINVTHDIFWNELAHAMSVGPSYPSSEADTDGVHDILFDSDTIIHDTGKASLIGIYSDYTGTTRNVTFSNIVAEESRALIIVATTPQYGATANPGIIQNVTFSNINQTVHQVTGSCCSGYITPVPNIQLLVALPYGNPYIGNGTTSGTNPAVIQNPINFNNVTIAGVPVTTRTYTQGNYNGYPIPAESLIDETVLLRTQNTTGPFVYEPSWIPLDILPPYCNGAVCTLGPTE